MVCGDPATLPDWTALAFHYSPPQMMISVDKFNWNKHFQTSFRRARRGSSDRTPRFRSPNTLSLVGTLDENRFKEDTITRKNFWAHHKDISNVPLKHKKQVKGNITTRYGASPGSILRHQDVKISVLAQASLIYHIRWRYLGVARPTETKSVRQTGLKLSKYLHIFIMIFNIHNDFQQ